jgi:dTMP kinase
MTLITVEGGDGAGKGTLVAKLQQWLEEKGYAVAVGREPGSVDIAEEIRSVIQRPRDVMNHRAELFLFEAARAQFVEEFLEPALEDNDVVILDRFYDSTTAYQGYGRGLELHMVKQVNEFATGGIIPDRTFILDVPPRVGLERCEKDEFGDDGDRFEQEVIDFHERLREGYLQLAQEEERFVVIDADRHDADAVFDHAKDDVRNVL